jgi:hypothetical protein
MQPIFAKKPLGIFIGAKTAPVKRLLFARRRVIIRITNAIVWTANAYLVASKPRIRGEK